jgi:nucleoid DNA-binding protein
MKKSEFIDMVAKKADTTRAAAARMVDAIFDTTSGAISEAVRAGSRVSIPGFGRFTPKTRPARKGRNPRTGVEIDIPERMVVAFSPAKSLQESLKGGGGAKKAAGGAKKAASGAAAKKTAAKKTVAKKGATKKG